MSRSAEALEVQLFVCPEPTCRLIGKRPFYDGGSKLKGWCSGPMMERHPKKKMALVRFVEAA